MEGRESHLQATPMRFTWKAASLAEVSGRLLASDWLEVDRFRKQITGKVSQFFLDSEYQDLPFSASGRELCFPIIRRIHLPQDLGEACGVKATEQATEVPTPGRKQFIHIKEATERQSPASPQLQLEPDPVGPQHPSDLPMTYCVLCNVMITVYLGKLPEAECPVETYGKSEWRCWKKEPWRKMVRRTGSSLLNETCPIKVLPTLNLKSHPVS